MRATFKFLFYKCCNISDVMTPANYYRLLHSKRRFVILFTFFLLDFVSVATGRGDEAGDVAVRPLAGHVDPVAGNPAFAHQMASTVNTTPSATTRNTSVADSEYSKLVSLAWGRYQVTHTYFTTIPYINHQVLIYQQQPGANQQNFSDGLQRYFYQPALIMDVDGVTATYNPFILQYEVVVPVMLWNDEYENHIRKKMNEKLRSANYLLTMIPVEGIRIKATGPNKALAIMNRWASYSSQPSVHSFRISCASKDGCLDLVRKIQDDPHQFTDDLRVYYSLEGQSSLGKRITVKAEHVQQSSMFSELKQRLPNKNPIYLTADDANKMKNEIANNILATEIQDEDFVSDESSPTLMALITKALDFTVLSSKGFDKEMWSSTFWKDENARPDKVTERVNEVYSKMQDDERKAFREEASKEKKKSQSTQVDVAAEGYGSAGAGYSSSETVASSSSSQGENSKSLAKEAAQSSEFTGEVFTPKEQDLRRINTGSVNTGTSLSTSQLRIARATSQITDQIKVVRQPGVRTFSGTREVFHVLSNATNPYFFKKDAKEVCMLLGGQLATLPQLEEAWLNGAEWCSSGHLDAGFVGYPGAVCYSKKKDDNGATIIPFQYVSVNCSEPFVSKNTYIYTAGDGNENAVEYWQFGANCWGGKPLKSKEYSYKSRALTLLNFNPTKYSQHEMAIGT